MSLATIRSRDGPGAVRV